MKSNILEEQEIYIGLYDLESEEAMTRLLFDADCFDCVYSKKDKAARNKVRRLMVYVAAELAKGEEVPF